MHAAGLDPACFAGGALSESNFSVPTSQPTTAPAAHTTPPAAAASSAAPATSACDLALAGNLPLAGTDLSGCNLAAGPLSAPTSPARPAHPRDHHLDDLRWRQVRPAPGGAGPANNPRPGTRPRAARTRCSVVLFQVQNSTRGPQPRPAVLSAQSLPHRKRPVRRGRHLSHRTVRRRLGHASRVDGTRPLGATRVG